MGRQHNELRRGPWSRGTKNALGDSKGEGGIERYGETMQPVMDLWSQPEWAALRDDRLIAREHGQAATPLELAFIAAVNPVGTDKIVVIEKVKCRVSTADTLSLGLLADASIAGTDATDVFFAKDRRTVPNVTNAMATTLSRRGANAASIVPAQQELVRCSTAAVDFEAITPPYILRPGDALVVECQTVNLGLNVTWLGRERAALPGELG